MAVTTNQSANSVEGERRLQQQHHGPPQPQPVAVYPSLVQIVTKFVSLYLIQICVVGSYVIQVLEPTYTWSRKIAVEYHVSDAHYFAFVLSSVHTLMFVTVNTRKFYFLRECKTVCQYP